MSDNLVELVRLMDLGQAHIVRGLLESNDIPCFIFDEHSASAMWHLQIALKGVRVMVHAENFEQAKELLSDIPLQENEHPPAPHENSPGFFKIAMAFLVTLASGVPFILKGRKKS